MLKVAILIKYKDLTLKKIFIVNVMKIFIVFNVMKIFKLTLIYAKYTELIVDPDMTNKEVFSTPPLLNPIFLTSTNATCITCTIIFSFIRFYT